MRRIEFKLIAASTDFVKRQRVPIRQPDQRHNVILGSGLPPLGSAAFVPVSWFKSAKSAAKIAREVAARYDTIRNTDRINVRTVETSAHLVPFPFGRSDAHGRFRDLEERIQSCQSLANVQLRPAIQSL